MKAKRNKKIPFARRLQPETLKKLKADAKDYGVNDTVYLELPIREKIQSKESGKK